jgi:Zn-dependent membrane protease YugP
MPFFYFDYYYIVLIIPALLISIWAQYTVKSTFNRYSKVFSSRGYTAAQIARYILDNSGLSNVAVERVGGNLTDHFDPKTNVVRLSDSVYNSTSVAAIGVAAHEVGHAIQHAEKYAPIKVRSAIIPLTQIGSTISMPLILLGFVFSFEPIVTLGIVFFSFATLFQLVTLPVEFNASNRALRILDERSYLYGEELRGAKKTLTAAAMTYVAALLVSAMQLLRLILLFGGRSRRD